MNTCDGIRIAMASVGDADAILAMSWQQGIQTNVLIDAGTKSDYPTVKQLLREFGVRQLHHVINSHPHSDHQGGLIELAQDREISISQFWMHLPWHFLDFGRFRIVLSQAGERKRARQLREAFESSVTLCQHIEQRRIPVSQPFAGTQIGPFIVAGPTSQFYSDRLHEFDELAEIIAEDERRKQVDNADTQELVAEYLGMRTTVSATLEHNPITEPENNTSTILYAVAGGNTVVLTADAGAPALLAAIRSYPLARCQFMQIPHHGSWHNISPYLIEQFRPTIAFVSAVGDRKHPRQSVVNAFKAVGTSVYSTHYPSPMGKSQSYGNVPACPWTGSATSLWNATT